MKTSFLISIALFAFGVAQAQESMSADLFRQLTKTPGDTNALRPELASLPFWKTARCSITMKYQDGHTFQEECTQNAKTIGGKYIVFSTDSKFYKQTMYAIGGYDEKASAIRLWGLYGNVLTQTTVVFDLEHRVSASTSAYADFIEISAGRSSDTEMSNHTLVYKDGVLFMTRDVKTRPLASANSVSN